VVDGQVMEVLDALVNRQYPDTLTLIGTHNQWLKALATGQCLIQWNVSSKCLIQCNVSFNVMSHSM
jgi:hypothetical protein